MMRLRLSLTLALLATIAMGFDKIYILVFNASKFDSDMQTGDYFYKAKVHCAKKFIDYNVKENIPASNVRSWTYDRFKQQLYCVISSNTPTTSSPIFHKSDAGDIILSVETTYTEDSSLQMGCAGFGVWLPKAGNRSLEIHSEMARYFPEYELSVSSNTSYPTATINLFRIEICDLNRISWSYPDFEMEALNKLEQLAAIPLMRDKIIAEIRWPNLQALAQKQPKYLDAYYTVDGPIPKKPCTEFLKTLETAISKMFHCKAVGEEMSRLNTERKVLKLALYLIPNYEIKSPGNGRLISIFANRLQRRDGLCAYPVQLRRLQSFHEPSNITEPSTGYTFRVIMDAIFQYERNEQDICTKLNERIRTPIALCILERKELPREFTIVTEPMKENVLNAMTQIMSEFKYNESSTCVFNVALSMMDKFS